MQKKLPAKVGKFLKATCVQLLSYCNPDCEKAGVATQMFMLDDLVKHLATEKQHLREARAQQEELKDRLYKKKALYLKVLLHCLGLLKQMACKFRLEIQSSLDQFKTKYFMVKCNAYFLKFCDNEMEILSETYTPEVVNVHRTIRDKLQSLLTKEEEDLVISHRVLLEYEIMGPEFEKVVEVYTKLHEKIKTHRWMLAELNK
uniref:HAUS augmin-like complex subunit 4 n=1 Tax=Naja naja TaxID=35670 RepID=A0A8C6VPM0_NAJNA